jgi:hypothetical protein
MQKCEVTVLYNCVLPDDSANEAQNTQELVCWNINNNNIFINCKWVDTQWQWLFYMYTKYDIDYY